MVWVTRRKGILKPALFSIVKLDSGLWSPLVRFVMVDLNAAIVHHFAPKQLHRDPSENNSGEVPLQWEHDPPSV